MTSKQERTHLIDKIRRLPGQIEYLAGALSTEELTGTFVEGEWSAAQAIHHLADAHVNGYLRCRTILTEDAPLLLLYGQAQWGALGDASDGDVSASVQILRGLHARWTVFWETLPADAWQRTGIHPIQGPLTLEQLLAVYTRHGDAHIAQIRRGIAAQYGEAAASRPPTHAELLRRFDREWARLCGLVQRLAPAEFVAHGGDGERNDGEGGGEGWSPKDHVAHITSWERYLARTEIGGRPAEESLGFALEAAGARLTIEEINGRIYAANVGKSSAQVLAEFDAEHAEARAAVAGIDYAAWTGPVHEWYEHYLEHWRMLPIGRGQPEVAG